VLLPGYGQVSSYNFAAPSFYTAAVQFSQLVWAGSEKVGCAVAAGCSMPTFVCNYYPAGMRRTRKIVYVFVIPVT
jgi:hypothetical protein